MLKLSHNYIIMIYTFRRICMKLSTASRRLSEKPNFRIFQLYCINLTGRSIVI